MDSATVPTSPAQCTVTKGRVRRGSPSLPGVEGCEGEACASPGGGITEDDGK